MTYSIYRGDRPILGTYIEAWSYILTISIAVHNKERCAIDDCDRTPAEMTQWGLT
jgi:hypothetical protein